ncbi:carboxymuconolactone decarboxylase family protein [Nocardia brasiliensis]|uniref:carboxymuconolactone decarboxylase family protein n=1 Tax=Nocardia brasiliensis TaxID=37326 RepID=UPI002454C062|nr:carboxymuconolactone decarboxylase family protein [Nocardia brasiliensis]
MTGKNYPEINEHLREVMNRLGRETPSIMRSFGGLHAASTGEGALTGATKELMALAIGIAVHCDGCVAYHVHDALAAGATHAEVVETIGVAVMMGGGPSVVYGCEAFEALEQFETAAIRQ